MINVNEKGFVSARELHKVLEVRERFSVWFKRIVDFGFDKGTDFNLYADLQVQKEGNRTVKRTIQDYWLTVQMGKEVAMISKTQKSKEVRKYLISLSNKREQGLLYSGTEVINLLDMVVASYIAEFRQSARKNHLSTYIPTTPKPKDYAAAQLERNNVCGIDKVELEKRLNKQNKRYNTVETCLIKIDKFELIRISVIDCMIHFGKSKEYAVNIGNFAKELAKKRTDLSFTRINKMFKVSDSVIKTMELLNN